MMRQPFVCAAVVCIGAMATAQSLPWPFDMAVQRVTDTGHGMVVTTTGGVFDFRPATGEVLLRQRIGTRRVVGAVRLAPALLSGLKVIANDAEAIRLRGRKGLTVTVTCDSVLRIDSRRAPLEFTVQGSFAPQFLRVERPGLLALDDVGGFGVYALPELPRRMAVQQSGKGFSVQDELPTGSTLLVGV